MLKRIKNNRTKENLLDFIENRKSLSDEDKIIEASHLIDEVNLVDVDKAYSEVESKINESNKGPNEFITWITRVAAILLLPLLIYNLLNYNKNGQLVENSVTQQEIICPIGMKSHIILPDSSEVWLNSGSKINYEIPFVRDTRKLTLNGEAFLHVKKNKNSPFIVCSEETKVQVLGTRFNIKAYPDDDVIEVALEEGSIDFYFKNKQNKNVYYPLKPNDYLVFNKSTNKISVDNKELYKYFSWRNNVLVFDETPMIEVKKTLERWYGIKVEIIDNEILNYKFTTIFENETLPRVIELLELSSPISIKYIRGKIDEKTNKLNQSIVTFCKK